MKDFASLIRDIPDFPKKGIVFKDISTLIQDGQAFREVIDEIANHYKDTKIDVVVAIDARGFIFGGALAYKLGVSFVPVRKAGKLPYKTYEATYDLEYGTDTVAIHQDAFPPDSNVLILDDLIATGGTVTATVELVEKLGGNIVGIAFVIELAFLNGREKLEGYDVYSLIEF